MRSLQSKQYEIMLIFCSFHLKCLNVNQAASKQGAGKRSMRGGGEGEEKKKERVKG